MDYYIHEFEGLQKDFDKVIHDFPLFKEMIDEIEDKRIKEINYLLEKNEEYYLKKAIAMLKDLINYIKDTSNSINKEFDLFDKYARECEKKELYNNDESYIKEINYKVNEANRLIKSHDLKDLKEANKIMVELLKEESF